MLRTGIMDSCNGLKISRYNYWQEIFETKHHQYGNETVDIYMSENIISVNPRTPILEIQALMIKYDVGRVLVLSKTGILKGIVTRTDLIRSLHGENGINSKSYALFEKGGNYSRFGKEKIKYLMYHILIRMWYLL